MMNSPVHILVQSVTERMKSSKFLPQCLIQESPVHSHHNSLDRETEDDPNLRKEFPSVEGRLFEVWLNKGSSGLGLSIVASQDDHSPGPRGIVIMGVQPGGVADRSKQIMWGDMILKINDMRVIGMTQLEVQGMLMEAPPLVKFGMLRQPGGGGGGGGGLAVKPPEKVVSLVSVKKIYRL